MGKERSVWFELGGNLRRKRRKENERKEQQQQVLVLRWMRMGARLGVVWGRWGRS